MNTTSLVSCLARNYGHGVELVRIEDLAKDGVTPVQNEVVYTGRMISCDISVGPSKSHRITVWTKGRLTLETLVGDGNAKTPREQFLELEGQIAKSQSTPILELLGDDATIVGRTFNSRIAFAGEIELQSSAAA